MECHYLCPCGSPIASIVLFAPVAPFLRQGACANTTADSGGPPPSRASLNTLLRVWVGIGCSMCPWHAQCPNPVAGPTSAAPLSCPWWAEVRALWGGSTLRCRWGRGSTTTTRHMLDDHPIHGGRHWGIPAGGLGYTRKAKRCGDVHRRVHDTGSMCCTCHVLCVPPPPPL